MAVRVREVPEVAKWVWRPAIVEVVGTGREFVICEICDFGLPYARWWTLSEGSNVIRIDPLVVPANELSSESSATRDQLTREHRSWNMSRIRGKNTSPELIVRRLLLAVEKY